MPLLKEDAILQVYARLNIEVGDDSADVLSAADDSVLLTTEAQIIAAVDSAARIACRSCVLVPGRAEGQTAVGKGVYDLSALPAQKGVDGTFLRAGGDGSKMWAPQMSGGDVRVKDTALTYADRPALVSYYGDIETAPNGMPEYWCIEGNGLSAIRLYRKPNFTQPLKANGWILPPSIGEGMQQFDFMPDDDYSGILDHAAGTICLRKSSDAPFAEKIPTQDAAWLRWANAQLMKVPEAWRAMYGLGVVPLQSGGKSG